jgi:hypothetical protein
MIYFKKLLFGLLFLILFTGLHFFLIPLFSSYEWIFGLNQSSFNQVLNLSLLLLLSVMCLVIFDFLVNHRGIGIAVAILGAGIPLLFAQNSVGLLLSGFYSLALIGNYFLIEHMSKHYLSFSAPTLLVPYIKSIATMILMIICIGYYLSINVIVKTNGFALPESIIPDTLIERLINQQTEAMTIKGDKYIAQLPQLTPEQLQLLRQNPELLRQYGVDPALLDQYDAKPATSTSQSAPASTSKAVQVPTTTAISPTTAIVKKMALSPINDLLKGYQFLVAPVLALLLFSAFSFIFFFFFLFNFISGGLVKIIFIILEKTGFIHFEKETREVQKLVV